MKNVQVCLGLFHGAFHDGKPYTKHNYKEGLMMKKKQTYTGKIMALLIGVAIILGYLLTPLGLEPRMNDLRTVVIVPFFVAASLGIPIIALLSLFKRPRLAGVLVVINASLMLFLVAGDQAGFFFTTPPPTAITILEFMSIIVSIAFLLYGPMLYRESVYSSKPSKV